MSPREPKVLSYVIEETLEAGRADRIKAYSVGIEVFGGTPTLTPRATRPCASRPGGSAARWPTIPLVAGLPDPVIIDIPKGAYVPHFAWQTEQAGERPTATRPPTD